MKRSAIVVAALLLLALLAWRMRPNPSDALDTTDAQQPLSAPRPPPIESATETPKQAAQSPPSERAPASNPPSPTASMPTEILVRGNVRDDKGAPVPGVRLKWIDERGTEALTEAKDSSYAVAGLHRGRYLVELSSAGVQSEQFDVELAGTSPVEERNFEVHPNPTILIRLVSTDGAPLFGFDADQQPLPGNLLSVTTSRRATPGVLSADALQAGSDGSRFVNRWLLATSLTPVGPDCLGQVELFEPPPLFLSLVSGSAVVAQREIREAPAEVVFALSPEDLRSRLAGLRVRLLQSDGTTPAPEGQVMFVTGHCRAKSDPDGRVEIRDQPAGRHTITLGAPGCGGRMQEVTLEPGVVLDLGDVALTRGPKVSLRFEFAADSHPSVRFTFRSEQAGNPLGTLSLYDNLAFASGDKDPYELTSFAPGVYELRVIGLGSPRDQTILHLGARPVRVVIRDEPVNEITVKIVPQTQICLRVASDSARLSRWLISTQDGLPCQRVRISGRAPAFVELVPGEYTIARIDSEQSTLGTPQAFHVGNAPATVELNP